MTIPREQSGQLQEALTTGEHEEDCLDAQLENQT